MGYVNAKSQMKESVWIAFIFLAVLWIIYFADLVLPMDLCDFGIRPRTLAGLVGIPLAPFLHEGFGHLLSNSAALLVLLTLLFFSQPRPWDSLLAIGLLGGSLLWLIGRAAGPNGSVSVHIGASLVIFGLITFLIASGFWQRRAIGIVIATGVFFFYGGSLFWGILPKLRATESWEGHLSGAIAGIIVAWFARDRSALGSSSSPSVVGKSASNEILTKI